MKKRLSTSFLTFFIFTITILEPMCLQASEDLTLFEKEIVYARQKQEALSHKMDLIRASLDGEKSRQLEVEADRLLSEVMVKGAVPSGDADVKSAEVKFTPIPRGEAEKKVKPKAPHPFVKRLLPWVGKSKDVSVTDGESLYKVAVSDGKITLREAIDIGLANSIGVQAAKKKIEVAEAKLVEAKRARFPTVAFVTEENGGIAGERPYKGRNYKMNVTQPLFYGGELVLTQKQAEEGVKTAKADYEKTHGEYIHAVRSVYYNVVKAEYNAQYQAALYEEVNMVYKRLREERLQKILSEVDFLNIESQYLQVYFQTESARNDLLSADLILRQTIEVPSDQPLPLDLKLNFKKIEPTFEELYEIAKQKNPDVVSKEHSLTSAQYAVEVYRAKKYPRIDLRGSVGKLGEAHKDDTAIGANKHNIDPEKEWFIGLQTSMPLGPNSIEHNFIRHKYGPTVLALTGSEDYSHKVQFNLFDKFSDITDEKQAEATILSARGEYEKAQNDLLVGLRDDFYNIQKSLIQVDASAARIRYQEKQNDVLKYLLQLQESGATTFIEGLIEQAQNKFSFIQAVIEYHLAVSNLNLSIGDPFYFET